MAKSRNLKLSLLFLITILLSSLSAQTIVKIEKTDQKTMNLLESLKLNLCFEMNDYIVVSVNDLQVLSQNNIKHSILSNDVSSEPLYIVSPNKFTRLESKNYIGEIVLDSDIRIEKINHLNIDLTPRDGIKFIPVNISNNHYQNIKKVMEYQNFSNERNNLINTISNSVNADSIAWFIQSLEDFGTRYAMHQNRRQVSQWIANQFLRLGYTEVYLDSFFVGNPFNTWQYNVVCEVTGTDFPDKYIVVGGHHDSIVNAGHQASLAYAPGADDNASGVAKTLETARVMKLHNYQPKSSIRFITFAMEEFGLYGAFHDAESIVSQGLNVAAMINSDMIANSTSPNWIFVARNYPDADFITSLAFEYGQEYNMQVVTSDQYIQQSDSWAYHANGIPAIFFAEYDFSPHYHSSADILANLNMPYTEQFIKLISSVIMRISDMPDMPTNYQLIDAGNGNTLIASWDHLITEGVSYKIIVKNLNTQEVNNIFTSNNYLEITGLTTGNEYEVTLYAQIDNDLSVGQSRFSSPLVIPRPVVNFSYESQLNQIALMWDANTEADLYAYNIYRKTDSENDYSLINTVLAPQTTFIDNSTLDLVWYSYMVRTVDNDNNESNDSQVNRTRHISLNSGILVIDFTYNANSLIYPAKELVDQFYRNILDSYDFEEIEYQNHSQVKIEEIGPYSTIIIHKNSFNTISNSSITQTLKNYIDLGGSVIFTGNDPLYFMHQVINSYPQNYNQDDFPMQYFNISSVNNNNSSRLARALPNSWANLPVLNVNPEKTLAHHNGKLFKIEAYTVNQDNSPSSFEVLYTFDSQSDNAGESIFDGYPVAIYKQIGQANIVLTSLPLYFFEETDARQFIQTVLNNFGENTNINDEIIVSLPEKLNLRNYPNPFNPETIISFNLPKSSKVMLSIYNVKGQLVKEFPKNNYNQGKNSILWNGLDNNGNLMSSGIYFYKLNTDIGLQQINKMILLK